MGRETLSDYGMGQGTHGEVCDGSGDSPSGPVRVGGPYQRSETDRGTLGGGPGWFGGTYRRHGMGRGTLLNVWDRLGDPLGGPVRVGGPSGRFRTGQGTIGKVHDGLGGAP